jgi:hypothetical protein
MITKDESSNENSTLGFIHQMGEFSTLWRVLTMTKTSEEVHLELCHPSELPSVLLPDRCGTYPNNSPQLQTRSESLRLHQARHVKETYADARHVPGLHRDECDRSVRPTTYVAAAATPRRERTAARFFFSYLDRSGRWRIPGVHRGLVLPMWTGTRWFSHNWPYRPTVDWDPVVFP